MDDHEDGVSAVCPRTHEVRGDVCEASEHAAIHHDRNSWLTIDTVCDMIDGQAPTLRAHHPATTAANGVLSTAYPHVPTGCPLENFVTEFSLAVNAALSGFPRRLEQLLPSDSTIERLLRARGAANEMAREPARLYLRFLYSAILVRTTTIDIIKYPVPRIACRPLPKWRFERVRKYIDSHIGEPIRLAELANVVGLSRMHFAAQFRAYVGISPRQFVMMQRIRRAQVLLSDARNSIVDVAFGVGFQTQAHFTTTFNRYVGETPHRWRKALRE